MPDWRFMRNVLWKAALLFAVLNLIYSAWNPTAGLGRLSLYNGVVPGRARFPFGENPEIAYNLSLYNLNAMFASHEIDGAPKAADEFRVILIGDSSVWGTLLRPEETLAGQLNTAGLLPCGKTARFYNLGYPTISLVKDVMILEQAMQYQPDLIIWGLTLESFPRDKQLSSPLVANNAALVEPFIDRYHLSLDAERADLVRPTFWQRTLIGQRRDLADLLRLQVYGVQWAATGIDQEYPANYPPAQRDLEPDTSYHGWQPPALPEDGLSWDVLEAGMQIAGDTPLLLLNEPMLISGGQNSDIRYNFFYPRWAYDQYRARLTEYAAQRNWHLLDAWNALPEESFTNSAIHLTPQASAMLARQVGQEVELICH